MERSKRLKSALVFAPLLLTAGVFCVFSAPLQASASAGTSRARESADLIFRIIFISLPPIHKEHCEIIL